MSSGSSGDGDEVSSESSLNVFQKMSSDFRLALEDFRSKWEKELKQKQNTNTGNSDKLKSEQHRSVKIAGFIDAPGSSAYDDQAEQQALAKNLFQKAVELEQVGKVYDAIPFYRKAVQIEPDIEFKYYEHQKLNVSLQNSINGTLNTSLDTKVNKDIDLIENSMIENLYEKFQLDLSKNNNGRLIQSSRDPGIISTEMHISELPPELLINILRWVVSNQLDIRSLDHCAAVCKGMYILARDEELWKLACIKVWGHAVGTLSHLATKEEEQNSVDEHCAAISRYSSWRQMFIERERVLFNGCYISKTTYLRMGENSFQDQYYRPVQLVEYYRYIRFLPDGTVLMMTSSDEPTQSVTKLKSLHPLKPDILRGHYRLFGSTLSVVVSKPQQTKFITHSATGGSYSRPNRRGNGSYDEVAFNCTKYCIEFRILNTSKRRFAQLVWLHYSVVQIRNTHETTSEFDLTASKYPPLWFSPVRSYHLEADAPLA